jgi:phosphoribosylformylglycinamidine (FGAM) synthase PurS component
VFLVVYLRIVGAVESLVVHMAARSRVRRAQGQSGQGALEYVGMLMVAAILVAALIKFDIASKLTKEIGNALKKAFGN